MSLMNKISLGQFIPGESYVHQLDPRCKIIVTFILLVGLFTTDAPLDFLPWLALLFVISRLAGIPMKTVLRSARPVWFLVAITVLLNLFWTPGREVFRWGLFRVTEEGLVVAFCMGTRLFFLVVFAGMLMMTTSPMAFSDGLERILSPLARLRLPVSEMSMMMTIALRFIPTLFEETDRILKAQISRGADFESGGLLKRARSFVPVLIPLFVLVFQRAENLAVAMESRCYVPGAARTRMRPLVWDMADSVALISIVAFILFAFFFEELLTRLSLMS